MHMSKRMLVLAAVLASVGAAHAQEKRVSISPKATYDQAVVCYQYYAVAAELARKLEKDPRSSADQAAGFQLQALAAKRAVRIGREETMRDRQIDRGVAAVDVAPVDHAAELPVAINQQVTRIEIAMSQDAPARTGGICSRRQSCFHDPLQRPEILDQIGLRQALKAFAR